MENSTSDESLSCIESYVLSTLHLARCNLRRISFALIPFGLIAACGGGDVTQIPMDVASPQAFQCLGRNYYTGAVMAPFETSGTTVGSAYAISNFDTATGNPYIVYGPRYFQMQPLVQSFIRRHECQHTNFVTDEIQANCGALIQMRQQGLTASQEDQIAQWTIAEGAIGLQYGGTGAVFWNLTLACSGPR